MWPDTSIPHEQLVSGYKWIHVAGYKYPTRATCIRIQVDTCRRDDNFVADTGYNVDGDRRYKWIQLVSGLRVSGVNAIIDANVFSIALKTRPDPRPHTHKHIHKHNNPAGPPLIMSQRAIFSTQFYPFIFTGFPQSFSNFFPRLSIDHFPWPRDVTRQCTIFYFYYIITSIRNIKFYQLQSIDPIHYITLTKWTAN